MTQQGSGVICIGECMVELRRRTDGAYDQSFAGDAFNAAAYLKRSAPGVDVHFLTATGADPLSAAMRAAWRTEGVSDDLAFTTPDALPGLYIINLDARGERTFTYWRSASAARRWLSCLESQGGAAILRRAALVYFSGISLAILPPDERTRALAVLAAARSGGVKLAFDPNYRPALWASPADARQTLTAAMELADIFRPSQDDLDALGLTPPPHSETVITRGAGGCIVQTPDLSLSLPTPNAEAVDTSGAGDSFTGAYLAARLTGAEPDMAARAALDVAARVVTARGALVAASVSHPAKA